MQASFFRHHNCNTTDTQLKYKSRAAQLYRDKLHGESNKAMRVHGTKLFINAPQSSKNDDEDEENKMKEDEADFFEKHSEGAPFIEASRNVSLAKSVAVRILLFINFFLFHLIHSLSCLNLILHNTINFQFCRVFALAVVYKKIPSLPYRQNPRSPSQALKTVIKVLQT